MVGEAEYGQCLHDILMYNIDVNTSDVASDVIMTHVDSQGRKNKGGRMSTCVGCGSQIHDQYILRVSPDLEWHAACLKCADCQQQLDETHTCFVRDGKTFCKRDYIRLFGVKCSKCSSSFAASDLVMRAHNNIYHTDCFRCVACSRPLIPGDEFALREDGLFCKADHDVVERALLQQATLHQPPTPSSKPLCGDLTSDLDPKSPSSGTSISNNNNDVKPSSESSRSVGSERRGEAGGGRGEGRRKHGSAGDRKVSRVRTVMNEKQLHMLRACYGANPRPDALMKEQLVEMTGLSSRVIRVWFQNKRCKDKKRAMMIKQMSVTSQSPYELKGVPMIASSPVRHEPVGMQATPVEVQSYPAPWKALSDFAMQSDLDQVTAPFQQLVNSFGGGGGECESSDDEASVITSLDDPSLLLGHHPGVGPALHYRHTPLHPAHVMAAHQYGGPLDCHS